MRRELCSRQGPEANLKRGLVLIAMNFLSCLQAHIHLVTQSPSGTPTHVHYYHTTPLGTEHLTNIPA